MAPLDVSKLRFMLITDRRACALPLAEAVDAALAGGFTAVQLREKDLSARELYELAAPLREIATRRGALLIVNDRIDVALAVGADAAHLGWRSLPPCDGPPPCRARATTRSRFASRSTRCT